MTRSIRIAELGAPRGGFATLAAFLGLALTAGCETDLDCEAIGARQVDDTCVTEDAQVASSEAGTCGPDDCPDAGPDGTVMDSRDGGLDADADDSGANDPPDGGDAATHLGDGGATDATDDAEADASSACEVCDPVAECDASGDEVVCTCPDTHSGDGKACESKCAQAGCDANAECALVDGAAQCACVAPYVGDGTSCEFDETCSLLSCHAEAVCVVEGDARTCECRAGFSGDGEMCTNEDDCDLDPCGPGTCTDLVLDFECDCPDGYSGKRCQNDACEDDPCDSGFECLRVPEGRVCEPACAPNCEPGSQCLRDSDCEGSAFCHEDGVCVQPTCTGGEIENVDQLQALQYCEVITGGISIDNTDGVDGNSFLVPTSTRLELPYVRAVSGVIQTLAQPLEEIDLPALEEAGGLVFVFPTGWADADRVLELRAPVLRNVGGHVRIGNSAGGGVDMRSLESVGGDLTVGLSVLSTLRLDALESVDGDLTLSLNVDALELGALDHVGGNVVVWRMVSTPWSEVAHLASLGQSQAIEGVGCLLCPESNRYMCDGLGDDPCP